MSLPKWILLSRVFLYIIAVALFVGLSVGAFCALLHGYIPVWFIPVHVIGSIGVAQWLVDIFVKFITGEETSPVRISGRYAGTVGVAGGLLALTVFAAGFLVPYAVTGNLDGLESKIRHIPETITGRDIGNFEEKEFEKAYRRAIAYIGNRRVESLLFYKDFTAVTVEKEHRKNVFDNATIRGASISAHTNPSGIHYETDLFAVNDFSLPILKKALADVARKHNLKDLIYVGLRRDYRWETWRGNGSPDRTKYADIKFAFKGGNSSLRYNGKTGVRVTRR